MISIMDVKVVAEEMELERLQAQLASLKSVKKNQKPGKPGNSKYVRLRDLDEFGVVPQQQRDVATILHKGMQIGVEYSEKEVFDMLVDGCGDFASITKSVQDVTYLFRYYRGLKNDGRRAGFIARGFLRMS